MRLSTQLIDTWTVVHYLYGVHMFAVSRWGWNETLVIAVLWEIAENTRLGVAFWSMLGDDTYAGDAFVTSASDVTAVMLGWELARKSAAAWG